MDGDQRGNADVDLVDAAPSVFGDPGTSGILFQDCVAEVAEDQAGTIRTARSTPTGNRNRLTSTRIYTWGSDVAPAPPSGEG